MSDTKKILIGIGLLLAAVWYMSPSPVQTHFKKGDTSYVNRDGNRIAIPGQSSTGATARCRNGSWSYSQHRNGTCSQEGGVAEWLR